MHKFRRSVTLSLLALTLWNGMAMAQSSIPNPSPIAPQPLTKYVDPTQLSLQWMQRSFYRQPWRAYMETRSGYDFLQGIGINYNLRGNDVLGFRALSDAGFKTVRIEVPWGTMRWDETGLTNEDRVRTLMRLAKQNGIRPLFLLNGHHGAPGPMQTYFRRIAVTAPAGSTAVQLNDVSGLTPGRSGLSNLTSFQAAQVLFTSINTQTRVCQLSRPLPVNLAAGAGVNVANLKYLPLYPQGTPQFDETTAGWVKYALTVCRIARQEGLIAFDVEIWNELHIGSLFLNINNYYSTPVAQFPTNVTTLNPGGHLWEFGNRTVQAIKTAYPEARIIWGFSNITPFHTRVENLPSRLDGQSFHPYGTGTRTFPRDEQAANQPALNVDGWTPNTEFRTVEGWTATFQQTETMMRLINPFDRRRRPQGTSRYYEYFTEHGVLPSQMGITNSTEAWDMRAKAISRAFMLWLNKGVDVMHYFSAWDTTEMGYGMMHANFADLPANASRSQWETPPLGTMRRLTSAFAGSQQSVSTRQLKIDMTALSAPTRIFDGGNGKSPLWTRDLLAVLPFQVNPNKFIIGAYIMTLDIRKPINDEVYRFTIGNLPATMGKARAYDPIHDRDYPVRLVSRTNNQLVVEMAVNDTPRLLIFEP